MTEVTQTTEATDNLAVLDQMTEQEPKRRGRPKKNPVESTGTTDDNAGEAKAPRKSSAKVTKELLIIREGFQAFFISIGTGVMLFNVKDSQIILSRKDAVVDALVKVAETNDKLRHQLISFFQVSASGQLVAAIAMMIVPILANHELIPMADTIMGAYDTFA